MKTIMELYIKENTLSQDFSQITLLVLPRFLK